VRKYSTLVRIHALPELPLPSPFIDKLHSHLLLKVLPLIKNAPFLIIASFNLVLIMPSISV